MVQDLRRSFFALLTGLLLWSGCAFAQNNADVSVNVNISAEEIANRVINRLDQHLNDSIDPKIKVQ